METFNIQLVLVSSILQPQLKYAAQFLTRTLLNYPFIPVISFSLNPPISQILAKQSKGCHSYTITTLPMAKCAQYIYIYTRKELYILSQHI